jgi:hypothetical protein
VGQTLKVVLAQTGVIALGLFVLRLAHDVGLRGPVGLVLAAFVISYSLRLFYEYWGTTFFKSQRASRLWSIGEPTEAPPGIWSKGCGSLYYHCGNTETDSSYVTAGQRVRFKVNRMLWPLVRHNRLLDGGTFVMAQAV